MVEFSADSHYRSLFLTDFFAYLHCSAPSTWSKSGLQKKKTSDQRTTFVPIRRSARPVFDTQNVCQPASSSENMSATKSQILLTTRLKSTSGTLTHLHSLEVAPSTQLFDFSRIKFREFSPGGEGGPRQSRTSEAP